MSDETEGACLKEGMTLHYAQRRLAGDGDLIFKQNGFGNVYTRGTHILIV